MKLFYLLVICALSLAVMADEKPKLILPTPAPPNLPQLVGGGGGNRKDGFGVSVDAHQKVWTSDNGRHSIGVTPGYSQHLGGPYGNSRPDYRIGAGYSYNFG
uniref:Diptericin-D n=1 Tax=Protophormia terraenovae TaxID=34676 RepID=DIPD_PROTE|nr:RecName: Full=Diptericin-D; Flags: Precursor [Protophormia terraenovae]